MKYRVVLAENVKYRGLYTIERKTDNGSWLLATARLFDSAMKAIKYIKKLRKDECID